MLCTAASGNCSGRQLCLLPWVVCCALLADRKALGRQQGAAAAAQRRTEGSLVQLLLLAWLREGKERILQGLGGDKEEEEETFTPSRCCYCCPSDWELLPY